MALFNKEPEKGPKIQPVQPSSNSQPQPAAAAVHAVVSVGPGWNWATVSNLYGDPNAYTGQLRALEAYCNDHSDAAAPRFLLAYHYLVLGHVPEAVKRLQEVVKLSPNDQLAKQLIQAFTYPETSKPSPG